MGALGRNPAVPSAAEPPASPRPRRRSIRSSRRAWRLADGARRDRLPHRLRRSRSFRLRLVDAFAPEPAQRRGDRRESAASFERAPDLAAEVRVAAARRSGCELRAADPPPALPGSGAGCPGGGSAVGGAETALTTAIGPGPRHELARPPGRRRCALLALSEDDATATIEAIADEESPVSPCNGNRTRGRGAIGIAGALLKREWARDPPKCSVRSAATGGRARTRLRHRRVGVSRPERPAGCRGRRGPHRHVARWRPGGPGGPGPPAHLARCGLDRRSRRRRRVSRRCWRRGEPASWRSRSTAGNDLMRASTRTASLRRGLAGILLDCAGNDVYRAGDHNGGVGSGRSACSRIGAVTTSTSPSPSAWGRALRLWLPPRSRGPHSHQGSAHRGLDSSGLADWRTIAGTMSSRRRADQLAMRPLPSVWRKASLLARAGRVGWDRALVDGRVGPLSRRSGRARDPHWWCVRRTHRSCGNDQRTDSFTSRDVCTQGWRRWWIEPATTLPPGRESRRDAGTTSGSACFEGGVNDRYDALGSLAGGQNANVSRPVDRSRRNDALSVMTAATPWLCELRRIAAVSVCSKPAASMAILAGQRLRALWLGAKSRRWIRRRSPWPRGWHSSPATPPPLSLALAPAARGRIAPRGNGVPLGHRSSPRPAGAGGERHSRFGAGMAFLAAHHRDHRRAAPPPSATRHAELVRRGAAIVPDPWRGSAPVSATERHAIKDVAVALGPEAVAAVRAGHAEDDERAPGCGWCPSGLRRRSRAGSQCRWPTPELADATGAAAPHCSGRRPASLPILVAACKIRRPRSAQAAAHALGERAEAERGQAKQPVATDRTAPRGALHRRASRSRCERLVHRRAPRGPAASPVVAAGRSSVHGPRSARPRSISWRRSAPLAIPE
jgi:hypothetical protein